MNYHEWLNNLKKIEKKNDYEVLEKLKNEPENQNLKKIISIQIQNTIKTKYNNIVKKIINEIEDVLDNEETLDLTLINYKKNINYIIELLKNKQMNKEEINEIKEYLINKDLQIKKILKENAYEFDNTGSFIRIIESNKIEWGIQDEL